MNHKALKFTFLVLFVVMAADQGWSQSKSGCEPKSCGPDNTKISEARVVTELRSELQSVITSMAGSSVLFSPVVTSFEIARGSSDDESVLFIAQAAAFVRAEFVKSLPVGTLMAEVRDFRPVPASTKQELLLNLKAEVQLLTEQASKI